MAHKYDLRYDEFFGEWTWRSSGREYKTNREREGLFLRLSTGEWVQCQGTGQFRLAADRAKALRQLHRADLSPDLL